MPKKLPMIDATIVSQKSGPTKSPPSKEKVSEKIPLSWIINMGIILIACLFCLILYKAGKPKEDKPAQSVETQASTPPAPQVPESVVTIPPPLPTPPVQVQNQTGRKASTSYTITASEWGTTTVKAVGYLRTSYDVPIGSRGTVSSCNGDIQKAWRSPIGSEEIREISEIIQDRECAKIKVDHGKIVLTIHEFQKMADPYRKEGMFTVDPTSKWMEINTDSIERGHGNIAPMTSGKIRPCGEDKHREQSFLFIEGGENRLSPKIEEMLDIKGCLIIRVYQGEYGFRIKK
jgi:hypothetical protein